MDRDGPRLARFEPELDAYIDTSDRRLRERQARLLRARRSRNLLVALMVWVGLLPLALFSLLVQGPTLRRAELLFDAGNRANRVALTGAQETVGDAAGPLDTMLRAAELVDGARAAEGSLRLSVSKSLLRNLGDVPLFSDQRDFLVEHVRAGGAAGERHAAGVADDVDLARRPGGDRRRQGAARPDVQDDMPCAVPALVGGEPEQRIGRLIVATRGDRGDRARATAAPRGRCAACSSRRSPPPTAASKCTAPASIRSPAPACAARRC